MGQTQGVERTEAEAAADAAASIKPRRSVRMAMLAGLGDAHAGRRGGQSETPSGALFSRKVRACVTVHTVCLNAHVVVIPALVGTRRVLCNQALPVHCWARLSWELVTEQLPNAARRCCSMLSPGVQTLRCPWAGHVAEPGAAMACSHPLCREVVTMATRHVICTKAEVGDDVAWRAEAMAPMLPPLQCPRPCTGAQVHALCVAYQPSVSKLWALTAPSLHGRRFEEAARTHAPSLGGSVGER